MLVFTKTQQKHHVIALYIESINRNCITNLQSKLISTFHQSKPMLLVLIVVNMFMFSLTKRLN